MKKYIIYILLVCSSLLSVGQTTTKKLYFTKSPELTFQFAQMEIANNTANNGMRVTYLLNVPYTAHINCSKYFGIMPSLHIKNIGFKTKNERIDSTEYAQVRRTLFTTGASLAIKVGMLEKGLWLYSGMGIDLPLLYRQKKYEPSKNNRVIKESDWFCDATETFIPSAFVGIQLPKGGNIKVAYYFQNMLNQEYNGSFGDFTNIKKSQLLTISVAVIIPDFKLSDIEKKHQQAPATEL